MQLSGEIAKRIEIIHLDNTSGATVLAIEAAKIISDAVEHLEGSLPEIKRYVGIIAQSLSSAQPTMAPLFNLANSTLLNIEETNHIDELRQTARATCRNFIDQIEDSKVKIGTHAAALINNETSVMTHSFSTAVLYSLLWAKKKGKKFDVICTESRPMREGVELAIELGRQDIKVKLIVDSAAYSLLPQVQLVLVGADAVVSNGIVNKIGTMGLSLIAAESDVNVYSLCHSTKFLPPTSRFRLQELRDPREIQADSIPNVTVVNYYYDITPVHYFTGIITEQGKIGNNEITNYVGKLKVHQSLR